MILTALDKQSSAELNIILNFPPHLPRCFSSLSSVCHLSKLKRIGVDVITSVDSGLCTVARLLTGIQERANQSFALGMYTLNSNSLALSVVSNFRRSLRATSPRNFAHARVCISPTPQSPSPKLETTRSLAKTLIINFSGYHIP